MPDRAETPIEISFTILIGLLILIMVEFVGGSIVDGFVYAISQVPVALSTWAQGIVTNYIHTFSLLVYATPVFFAIVILVWGYRALFRKQQTIRTESGIAVEEE